jgi:hypothetical protein
MLRFTIRDVPWLIVVVGTGAGWYVHVRAERAARVQVEDKLYYALELARNAAWKKMSETPYVPPNVAREDAERNP